MRILIHSNAPWVPSGYGTQAYLAARLFRELGHDTAISAFSGLSGAAITWNGIDCYPNGQEAFGWDVLAGHAMVYKADLVLTICDFWVLHPGMFEALRDVCPVAAWIPVDTHELGTPDRVMLQVSGVTPVAMSQHGHKVLSDAGFSPLYAPHSFDAAEFHEPYVRSDCRRSMQVPDDQFAVGICAANKDVIRKGFPEQFRAFSMFRKRFTDAHLYVHSMVQGKGGHDLEELASICGIPDDSITFSAQYEQIAGLISPRQLAAWHGSHDVTMNASYGEGFGIPVIESQACGTPVIVNNASAMPELCGTGWKVNGEPAWNPVHKQWWVKPSIPGLVDALGKAWALWKNSANYTPTRKRCAAWAQRYEARSVLSEYWKPALEQLERLSHDHQEARTAHESALSSSPGPGRGCPPGTQPGPRQQRARPATCPGPEHIHLRGNHLGLHPGQCLESAVRSLRA